MKFNNYFIHFILTDLQKCIPKRSLVNILNNSSISTNTCTKVNRNASSQYDKVEKYKAFIFRRNEFSISRQRQYGTTANTGTTGIVGDSSESKSLNLEEFRNREEKKDEESSKQDDSQSSTSSADDTKTVNIDTIRLKILNASLPHVDTHGWSRITIAKGGEACGYPGVVHGLFPEGGIELIRHFYKNCNEELAQFMQQETKDGESIPSNPKEFIFNANKFRLQMIEPYLSHWPQALALMSLPQNVPTSLAQLLTMIDDICYYSGDRSVDFAWYTRRIGVATIYKITELYLLQDKSVSHEKTWEFLRERIDEGFYVQEFLTQSEKLGENAQKMWNSAFITARNILGLDFNRR